MSDWSWTDFHAYRVFDEFIDRFLLSHKSYITKHEQALDFDSGLSELRRIFIDGFDDSKGKSFEVKIKPQFNGASDNVKIIFTNLEYLWAMGSFRLKPETKITYAKRWFPASKINKGERFFFGGDHTVADTGPHFTLNKYYELCSVIQLFDHLIKTPDLKTPEAIKQEMESFLYNTIYFPETIADTFNIKNKCATRNMLLHLSNPDKYEGIVSYSDKERIIRVFQHVLPTKQQAEHIEVKLKLIKSVYFDLHGNDLEPHEKDRWFFYRSDIKDYWKGKTNKQCDETAINLGIFEEENAGVPEGGKESFSGVRIIRDPKYVSEVKKRDGYTCRACGFYYKGKVVHAHHLDPLSERDQPELTKPEHLITLCPNCHAIAHHLLSQHEKYKKTDVLIQKLQTCQA